MASVQTSGVAGSEAARSALLRIDAGADHLVLTVQGPLDEGMGRLLHEALLVSDEVLPGSRVVVDMGDVGPVTTEGLRALVACSKLAAEADLDLRFRFGRSER